MLLQILRAETPAEMHRLVDKIAGEGITRDEARKLNRPEGESEQRARRYTYRYQPENHAFHFSLTFNKPAVDTLELIEVVRGILRDLEAKAVQDRAAARQESSVTPRGNGGSRGKFAPRTDWSERPR
jgi:hypothetical protein